jgi:hypothetical protein
MTRNPEALQELIDSTDCDRNTDRTAWRRTKKSDYGVTPNGNRLTARQTFGYEYSAAGILRQTAHHNIKTTWLVYMKRACDCYITPDKLNSYTKMYRFFPIAVLK